MLLKCLWLCGMLKKVGFLGIDNIIKIFQRMSKSKEALEIFLQCISHCHLTRVSVQPGDSVRSRISQINCSKMVRAKRCSLSNPMCCLFPKFRTMLECLQVNSRTWTPSILKMCYYFWIGRSKVGQRCDIVYLAPFITKVLSAFIWLSHFQAD